MVALLDIRLAANPIPRSAALAGCCRAFRMEHLFGDMVDDVVDAVIRT